jgi:hypothetical protein
MNALGSRPWLPLVIVCVAAVITAIVSPAAITLAVVGVAVAAFALIYSRPQ